MPDEGRAGALSRAARCCRLAAVLLLAAAPALRAQATGKLEGRVRDAAGKPIASAQVLIEGTTAVALADEQGYYFINNVQPGPVDLLARFIGHKPFRVTALRILAGQTITQDFALEEQPVDIGEIEVYSAMNVLVPRDEVTTKQRINGDFASRLPIDRIGNVLALQPGVVASPRGDSLNIRGGRTDEAATYIDGVPVSSGSRATGDAKVPLGSIIVGTGAFEEASVTTGAASAEFGNAQSGIVHIETRSGGSRLGGSASYETDQPFGVDHGPGFNRIEASLGGPVARSLSFAVSATLEGQQGLDNGFDAQRTPGFVVAGVDTSVVIRDFDGNLSRLDIPRFAVARGDCSLFAGAGAAGLQGPGAAAIEEIRHNYGVGCEGVRSAYTPRATVAASGKLSYSFGQGSRLSVSGLVSQFQARIDNGNSFVLAPQLHTGIQLRSQVYILNWSQNLSKSTERALNLETFLSYQEDRTQQGALTPQGERDSRSAFGGFLIKPLDFAWGFHNFPVTQRVIDEFRDGTGNGSPLAPNGSYTEATPYFLNPYGGFSDNRNFYRWSVGSEVGNVAFLRLSRERRYIGKANLDWQADRFNRIKAGGEITAYSLVNYFRVPADQGGCLGCDVYLGNPLRYDLFAENTLDLGDLVVVAGARYDYFDSRASHPFNADSGYPFPFTRRSDPNATYRRDRSHDYLSPHVQVSFPVTERTNFRLSYAHQVQVPDFSLIFSGINSDLNFGPQAYGTDLDFGKTILFEFGVRHAFSEDMVLDLSLYNKNKLSDVSARSYKALVGSDGKPQSVTFYTNTDFGLVRGIDVRLDRRIGSLFNGMLAYTFQSAKGTGSNPQSTVDYFSQLPSATGAIGSAPQAVLNTTDSRPHSLAGAVALSFPNDWHRGSLPGRILRNTGFFATFRLASGTPYTSCAAGAQAIINASVLSGSPCLSPITGSQDLLTTRLPVFKQFDLRVTRGFSLGGLDLTLYGDFRNLFNFRNALQVFATNGNISNPVDFAQFFALDSTNTALEASGNGTAVYNSASGAVDLTGAATCDNWRSFRPSAAGPVNCVMIRRAEQRFGNGDGIFTMAEQRRASRSRYDSVRGSVAQFLDLPRRIRVGMELSF